jgi:hypothetical protein
MLSVLLFHYNLLFYIWSSAQVLSQYLHMLSLPVSVWLLIIRGHIFN